MAWEAAPAENESGAFLVHLGAAARKDSVNLMHDLFN